jgi:hypothetical protein
MSKAWIKWLLAFVACLFITSYFHSGKKINGVIWSDQEGYYIYLPAVFVNGGFENLPCVNGCTFIPSSNGFTTFTKYTYGVALMEAPFFLVAHAVAPLLGQERDGRSLVYIWAIMIAAICYMLLGLHLIIKVLRNHQFGETVSWLVPLGLLFGTNLFYYTFREAGMSHVYSFFLFSVLVYASDQKQASNKRVWDGLSALVLALIILIRPTNAIAGLIPLFWGVELKDIQQKIKQFLTNYRWWAIFSVSLMIFFFPQLLYWKVLTGDYIFYSYGDEGFLYWNRPKIFQVLLSPQNGWLVYSPIVGVALLGIGLMLRDKVSDPWLPLVVLGLATYTFGSWWAWWFGGAYGHRCFVDFLPILSIPAAYAITKIDRLQSWIKTGFGILAFLAVFVNIRMSDIYQGMWDGPDWGWTNYIEKLLAAFYL